MKRSMMQVYVKGSDKAAELYMQAFGATMGDAYPSDDGTYMHCELHTEGHVLALAETDCAPSEINAGTTMQFCLHYQPDELPSVQRAYEALKEGAQILHPLGRCDYSDHMTDLIDRYGVRWCLFT